MIVQAPRISKWQGLGSNQSLLAWSQNLALSTTLCHRPYVRASLEMRDDAHHSEWRNTWNFSFVFLDVAMTYSRALGNLDLMPQVSKGFSSPFNEEIKSLRAPFTPMERRDRGAGSSYSLVLTFPFPHYFLCFPRWASHQCDWSASAWLRCELQKNTMSRALGLCWIIEF